MKRSGLESNHLPHGKSAIEKRDQKYIASCRIHLIRLMDCTDPFSKPVCQSILC